MQDLKLLSKTPYMWLRIHLFLSVKKMHWSKTTVLWALEVLVAAQSLLVKSWHQRIKWQAARWQQKPQTPAGKSLDPTKLRILPWVNDSVTAYDYQLQQQKLLRTFYLHWAGSLEHPREIGANMCNKVIYIHK